MENPNLDFSSLEPAFQALKWARENMPEGIEKSNTPALRACSSLAEGFEACVNLLEKSSREFSEQYTRCLRAEEENGVMKGELVKFLDAQNAIEKRIDLLETAGQDVHLPIVKVGSFGNRLEQSAARLEAIAKQPAVFSMPMMQHAEKVLQGQAGFAGDDTDEAALVDLNKQYNNQGDAVLKSALGKEIAILEIKLARRRAAAGF